MSGRKKHTKKQRGQPSTALLSELNAIRDLLNCDAETNIPLLDQIASVDTTAQTKFKPPSVDPHPLQEGNLSTLFSLIDEKPMEDFTSELGQMAPESLQDLPQAGTDPDGQTIQLETEKPAPSPQCQLPTTSAENPFLPPHIRARLTGGRVPKSSPTEPATPLTDNSKKQQQLAAETPLPSAAQQPSTSADSATTDKEQESDSPSCHQSCRQQLIEQLVAEQLPELEQLLRASIALMLDELEPKNISFRG